MIRIAIHLIRYRQGREACLILAMLALIATESTIGEKAAAQQESVQPVGFQGKIGCQSNPTRVKRLLVTKPCLLYTSDAADE